MLRNGEKISMRSRIDDTRRVYTVSHASAYDCMITSEDGLSTWVWTRDVLDMLIDGRMIRINEPA
jgi:hypothetical protein